MYYDISYPWMESAMLHKTGLITVKKHGVGQSLLHAIHANY